MKNMSKNIIYTIMIVILVIVWTWSAIHPLHFDDWLLENILVFLSIPLFLFISAKIRLSIFSCSLITIFMVLHIIGSHYTYAEVPFGFTLGEWLGTNRNMYDRLVHLSFGVLLVYPIREIFVYQTKLKGFWSYFVPIMIISAFAGFYEVMEWITAQLVNPDAGMAFLGSQGDIWDAQKDMFLAMIGALIILFF